MAEVKYPAVAWFPHPYAVFQFPELLVVVNQDDAEYTGSVSEVK